MVETHQNYSSFVRRHIGPADRDIQEMLSVLGLDSLSSLVEAVVPESILDVSDPHLPAGCSEEQALEDIRQLAMKNQVKKSLIGQGYYGTYTPAVIARNLLENPAWYTAYTPYQPEISQGRLEALFYFQTMVTELTAMDIANASLLDEGTAAAEAMAMCWKAIKQKKKRFLVARDCHPQTIDILKTRAEPLGIELGYADLNVELDWHDVFGILFQYPATDGHVRDYSALSEQAHVAGAHTVFAADLLALTLLKPPGEMGADIVIGNTQRFGVPLGMGGPHAAYMATTESLKRSMPGRLVGVSVDVAGRPAYRLALQTREQHIRREKATSNICTAQALLANIAVMYACYHGPDGLKAIAQQTHQLAVKLARVLKARGFHVDTPFFDTVKVATGEQSADILQAAEQAGYNLRRLDEQHISIAFDETCLDADVDRLLDCFEVAGQLDKASSETFEDILPVDLLRTSTFMSQSVFHDYHSETEMMRYLRRLSDKDLALDRAMIPLGSCTMKLNAAAEMAPISWPEFSQLHPFVPASQRRGYDELIQQLETWLCACTGYVAVSLQPNAGSQGEYAGLLAIKRYHESRGEGARNVCLIPSSAHGTNPASAQMCNMKVVVVACDKQGDIDLDDLDQKLAQHGEKVAAIMITYPSTHGVFEERITEVCEKVHRVGGQVYIDGANLNALIGLA
ncbi:MAG TPA: glycine dehydrogenase (aminomethyl-transferring), partial [Porticoccaceae bacterium]|nr:glycine dehydrogenase (aminomethyl-transferring) [Porticoccaceae bacterium]